jgi:hypothetical protein
MESSKDFLNLIFSLLHRHEAENSLFSHKANINATVSREYLVRYALQTLKLGPM